MNNLNCLIKYNLINSLNLNKVIKNKKEKRNIIILLVFIGLLILGFATGYMFLLGTTFNDLGISEVIILMGLSISSLLVLITSVQTTRTLLFHAKDYELLQAMPIKLKDIIVSKLMSLLIMSYLTILLLNVSCAIVYFVFTGFNVIVFLLIVLVTIFAPFIPVAIGGIISYLLSLIISKIKYKNLLSILLSIALVVFVVVINMNINQSDATSEEVKNQMINVFSKLSYNGYLSFCGIFGNYWYLLLYIGLSIVLMTLFILLAAKSYTHLNLKLNNGYTKKNFNIKTMEKNEKSGVFTSLLKIEIKKYFSISGYVVNTLIGPIIGTVTLAVLAFRGGLDMVTPEIKEQIVGFIALILSALVCLFSCMSPSTTSAISIEGKNFWILKTLPISTQDIFKSKLAVCILTCLPFTIINGIIATIFFHATLLDFIFIIAVPTMATLLMANVGLLMNLRFPRLDWVNPMKVVKQSASVGLTMLVTFGGILVVAGLCVLLISLTLDGYITLLFLFVIFLILWLISRKVLFTKGIKRFNEING